MVDSRNAATWTWSLSRLEFDRHAIAWSFYGAPAYSNCNLAVGILRGTRGSNLLLPPVPRAISSAFRQTDGGDDESTGANSRNGVGCIIDLSLRLSVSLALHRAPRKSHALLVTPEGLPPPLPLSLPRR